MKLDLVGDILKIDKKAYDEIVKLFKQNNKFKKILNK